VTEAQLEVSANSMGVQQGQVLELRPPVPVAGSVVDASRGQPIVNARVVAIPFGAALPENESASRMRSALLDSLARQFDTQTDATGHFSLSLDPGPYRFVVYPALSSGFAAQISESTIWVTRVTNSPAPTAPPAQMEVAPFRIGMPVAVSGDVIDMDRSPVAGATVQAFARIRENAANPMAPAIDVPIGSTTANAMGGFSLLLPSL
jgi:hypothetical protein